MKRSKPTYLFLPLLLSSLILLSSCDQSEQEASEYTGDEITYTLFQGTDTYDISGTVTLREKVDHSTEIDIQLNGTEGGIYHPSHFHLGDISLEDSDIAALLTPLNGETGSSTTHLTTFGDGTTVTYESILAMEASIKVHLSDDAVGKDIVLAGGNIGEAFEKNKDLTGKVSIAICSSDY